MNQGSCKLAPSISRSIFACSMDSWHRWLFWVSLDYNSSQQCHCYHFHSKESFLCAVWHKLTICHSSAMKEVTWIMNKNNLNCTQLKESLSPLPSFPSQPRTPHLFHSHEMRNWFTVIFSAREFPIIKNCLHNWQKQYTWIYLLLLKHRLPLTPAARPGLTSPGMGGMDHLALAKAQNPLLFFIVGFLF